MIDIYYLFEGGEEWSEPLPEDLALWTILNSITIESLSLSCKI